uniref:PIK-related kinase FAT domain-containing protein n=1 Tax=Meloidogyne incognita TaxID=6306 RepID=A0A914NGX3_MELIC
MSFDVETIDLVNVFDEEEDIQMDTTIEDDKKGRRRKNKEGEEEETIMEVDDKEDNKTKLNKIFDEIQESLCISNDEESTTTNTICSEWIENFVDLLYIDPLLCQQTFIELFTTIWSNLNENEREQICSFITPFLTSSAFCIPATKNGGERKKEDYFEEEKEENFVVSTILKALIKCKKPEIEIDPVVLSYVGSNFKCWHIALLKLEKIAISKKALISNIGGEITTSAWNAATSLTEEKLDTLDSLTRLYQFLNEFDQYNFVWRKRACFEKTIKCLAFYQQGDFVRARETAEKLMLYLNEKLFKSDSLNAVTPAILSEFQVFEQCWIDSCKQLNDWTSLELFSNSDEVANINLLTETAWHLSDWKLLKDCLIQLDAAGDPSMTIKSALYKLMINIANFDQLDFRPILNKEFNGKAFEKINKMLITNWKKLPSIISHSHLEILNLAHFTHEVCESANVINNNLQSINFPSHQQQQQQNGSSSSSNNLNTSVKHLLKSWRSRPITNIDQLNSLVDLFTWRSQFFCSILNFYENTDQKSLLTLPVHTLAQTQIQLSRMLRRSNQLELAQNELNKLHSSILVHPIDIHLKLVEHIKCLLRLSSNEFIQSSSSTTTSVKRSINAAQDALIEALNLIEGVQLNVLKRDQISRLMICKGIVLSKLD